MTSSQNSKKVFVLPAGENWIIDRFVKEFREDNPDINVIDPVQADVIWIFADFCWSQVPTGFLASKKVLTTIHHIVPEKFGPRELQEFKLRDQFTTAYHVPNPITETFIRPLTTKPIHVINYWANQNIWKISPEQPSELRKKHGLPPILTEKGGTYLIGSFQRDTEGKDLISPKLEKGPDLLADAIITYRDRCATHFPVEVVLAGWRRQYLMKRLDDAGVKYYYFDRPEQPVLNELYQCLDLYPVTARHEGGPQSLIECGLLLIPAVSRDVGIARQVLPSDAINDNVTLARPARPYVMPLMLPQGYEPYRKLIESL